MIKAVLFDLDGTLLPMDTHQFIEAYMKSLAPHMVNIIAPKKFIAVMMKSTLAMIQNKEQEKSNQQVFEETFTKETGIQWEEIVEEVDRFYHEEFPKLKKFTNFNPLASKVVQAAVDQGYKIVIATNPVFPQVAVLERLRWSGVHEFPFDWITAYEESHFCKPNIEYYQEIVERLQLKPNECVMVGNDMQEDMVASELGMKTFYLKDHPIDRGNPVYSIDQSGYMDELLEAIRNQSGVFRSV
ncbi:HAD family hydrolase [Thermoflavimicrobium daqui]|uniref:HAD family hydrolase n=1 Tax=Thermoflavimicrobium daqui TaxID=2137476 RepID=A0A364K9E8_9BACL|nr:HAD family hydrolase [Thermoflavimicrobium daqui]RAL26914.1 HAD family hydrolase [Thermoflavimicrobium daqui]